MPYMRVRPTSGSISSAVSDPAVPEPSPAAESRPTVPLDLFGRGGGSARKRLPHVPVWLVPAGASVLDRAAERYFRERAGVPLRFGEVAGLEDAAQLGFGFTPRSQAEAGSQCGAACLAAGLLLAGPEASAHAVDVLIERATALRAAYRAEPAAWEARTELTRVIGLLDRLERTPPERWTVREARELTNAIFVIAQCDQHARYLGVSAEVDFGAGLRGNVMLAYRDLLWPEAAITLGERRIDIRHLHFADGSEHFVLAEDDDSGIGARQRVVFDPWPQADGSASTELDSPSSRDIDVVSPGDPRLRGSMDLDSWRREREAIEPGATALPPLRP